VTADEFRAELKVLGKTQRWFAQYARVSASVVNRWATGLIPVAGYADALINALKEKTGK